MTESLVSVVYFVCHSLKTTTKMTVIMMIMMIMMTVMVMIIMVVTMIITMILKHRCNDKQQKEIYLILNLPAQK